jgi:hypothetical protein
MLALLPEAEDSQPRVPRYNIQGPRLNITGVTPELRARIRAIELGQEEPPTLKVDGATNRLVVLENTNAALADWLVYVLGGFSTCLVKWVELKPAERNTNGALWLAAQRKDMEELYKLLEEAPPPAGPFAHLDIFNLPPEEEASPWEPEDDEEEGDDEPLEEDDLPEGP